VAESRQQTVEAGQINHGRQAAKKFEIRWPEILPLTEIAQAKNEKIISFRKNQMARGFGLESE